MSIEMWEHADTPLKKEYRYGFRFNTGKGKNPNSAVDFNPAFVSEIKCILKTTVFRSGQKYIINGELMNLVDASNVILSEINSLTGIVFSESTHWHNRIKYLLDSMSGVRHSSLEDWIKSNIVIGRGVLKSSTAYEVYLFDSNENPQSISITTFGKSLNLHISTLKLQGAHIIKIKSNNSNKGLDLVNKFNSN